MDSNFFIQVIFLGILEGLTEFIPVSSTGHLIIFGYLMDFTKIPGKVFEVAIQLGAILAICVVYFTKLWRVVSTCTHAKEAQQFIMNVTIAFLPSMVMGILLHGFIKSVLFSPWVVGVTLIVGGCIILWIEKHHEENGVASVEAISLKQAFYIGCFQVCAMIPGTSRSGATIMGALLLKVNRKTATEFSFFLAIPTMFGAVSYDLYKNMANLSIDYMSYIALGFAAAFLSALLVVKTVIAFISTHGFAPFAYYRILLGCVLLSFLLYSKLL